MPKDTAAPYLFLKKTPKPSYYLGPLFKNYEWYEATPFDISTAGELSGFLITILASQHGLDPKSDYLGLLYSMLDGMDAKARWFPFRDPIISPHLLKKLLKISLEAFDRLDDISDVTQLNQAIIMIQRAIADQIIQGYTIGINFREVFLIEEGQEPPPNFRKGIDIRVNNRNDYKKQISKFSYQLAKAIFLEYTPLVSPETGEKCTQITDKIVYQYLIRDSLYQGKRTWIDLKTSLNNYRYFSCVLEALTALHVEYTFNNHIILPFGPATSMSEMGPIIDHFSSKSTAMSAKELIIILRSDQYKDLKERERVYNETLKLIQDKNCCFLLQVILLPDEKTDLNLIDLVPDTTIDGDFKPLAHSAGYYLSSPAIFSAIYRNIQANKTSFYDTFIKGFEKKCFTHSSTKLAESMASAYVYSTDAAADVRKSKTFNRQELKDKITLSITQQQELTQTQAINQEVSQTQQLTQQSEQTQQQLTNGPDFYIFVNNIFGFCVELKKYAEQHITNEAAKEQFLEQAGSLTHHYRGKYSKRYFWHQILNSESFRLQIAAKIFGQAYSETNGKASVHRLPGFSVDAISERLQETIMQNIDEFADGIDPAGCYVVNQLFSGHILGSITHWTLVKQSSPTSSSVSTFALQSNRGTHGYQSHLNYYVLLTEESLAGLSIDQKNRLIHNAESLLCLFQSSPLLPKEKILDLENKYLELIKFYFPEHPEYLKIVEKFISCFDEHNDDNLKIMLQVIIDGHKNRLEDFIKLMTYVDARCLLTNFYKIYFKYALNVYSVVNLLSSAAPTFIEMVSRTPKVSSADKWPLFAKFCHHFLLYATKNNLAIVARHITKLEVFHQRLYAKFLIYTEHQELEAQELLENLLTNLMSEDDLDIAPLNLQRTFFINLEKILDHAIAKHTLKEQIAEIRGISLTWTDAPYAIAHNGFQVICSEMKVHGAAINPATNRYSITLNELETAIKNHKPGDGFLKTAIFRYLGTESLRQDIAFYRDFYQKIIKDFETDVAGCYLKEMMLGYYVLTMTGSKYKPRLDPVKFSNDFLLFVRTNKLAFDPLAASAMDEFIEHAQHIPDDLQKGRTTLSELWKEKRILAFTNVIAPIPEIFTRKFDRNQLKRFILNYSDLINASTPSLTKDPALVYAIIETWLGKPKGGQFKNNSVDLLKAIYPKMDMSIFIKDNVKIALFMDSYSLLLERGAQDKINDALHYIFQQTKNIDLALAFIDLISNGMAQDKLRDNGDKLCSQFLSALIAKPMLLAMTSTIKPLLALTLEFYLGTQVKDESLPCLFKLCETLNTLETGLATQTLTAILNSMRTKEGFLFFSLSYGLTALQLQGMAQLMQKTDTPTIALPFIQLCLHKNPANQFNEINELLKDTSKNQINYLLPLCHYICSMANKPVLEQLEKLKKLPFTTLTELAHLRELYPIDINDFLIILGSPSITDAIERYERLKHEKKLERYDYEVEEVADKIAQIKFKSTTSDEDLALSADLTKRLSSDYVEMMSYMTLKPILIEQNEAGVKKEFTVHELSEKQFQTLLNCLKDHIGKGENKHQYELMLLALSCEALYRTTNKFPRNTQILSVLNSMNQSTNMIHEIKTGEGKSIIAALHGVLLCAEQKTVDIVTENNQLANDGLNKFSRFYRYLGIPCGDAIVAANSPHNAYVENGINYSTASGLSLFRTRMQIAKKPLAKNSSLICDEIDATLTTTVQYRLATTLDPLLGDTKSWSVIYEMLLDFVKEKDIFLGNKCRKEDDIRNLRNYCLLKTPKKALADFIGRIPNKLLEDLIESAMIANELEEDIDFVVIPKTKETTFYYAAPILSNTKRPDASVSYSVSVQQLLHTKLNRRKPAPKFSFEIEPSSETLVVVSAKNFFDYYRLNGGRTIGFTGTAGTIVERKEFHQYNALTAFSYPSFHESRAEDLGLLTAMGTDEHQKLILKWLQDHKKTAPAQPILIITNSPQATLRLKEFLAAHTDWPLQSYIGYEQAGCSEEKIIEHAGQKNTVTIANQCLARGADINPAHPQGILVINTCTDLTASDLRQIQGRAARNGKPGQYLSLIDATKLGTATSTSEEIAAAFKTHQHDISMTQQKERLKTRLLEEVRHHIVNNYIIKLRERADKILSRQFGLDYSLVRNQEFLEALSDFNEHAERHFAKLLAEHSVMDDAAIGAFIEARVNDYQLALTRWLPEGKFSDFKIVEPLIPLENLKALKPLNAVTMDQLSLLSELLSTVWQYAGHQHMQVGFTKADQVVETFDPYFKNERSFQYVLLETLDKQKVLDADKVKTAIDNLVGFFDDFIKLCTGIPGLGYFVPAERLKKFFTDYLTASKTQIQEKKWNELALPKPDFTTINAWFGGISTALTVSSVVAGGPIPFIVNNIVMPTLIGWLKTLIKKMFSYSQSSVLQLIVGIDDIATDLSNVFIAFSAIKSPKTMTIGALLDKIAPLLKNKALLPMVTKFFELYHLSHLTPFLQAFPELLVALEPYRARTLHEVLNVETLMQLAQQCCKFEPIKKLVEKTVFKEVVARISALKPEFISVFRHLSFPDALGLVKVIAHPNFAAFIKTLPPKTTFAELNIWLEAEIGAVPHAVKEALIELRDYQTNHVRIEEDSKRALTGLKEEFTLTTDKLKTDLERLKPASSFAEATVDGTASAVPTTQPIPWFKYGAILTALMGIAIYNVLFFTTTVLLTSLVIVGWFAYPYIKKAISTKLGLKDATIPETEELTTDKSIAPILVSVAQPIERASQVARSAEITLPTTETTAPTIASTTRDAYQLFGLFNEQTAQAQPPAIISSLSQELALQVMAIS